MTPPHRRFPRLALAPALAALLWLAACATPADAPGGEDAALPAQAAASAPADAASAPATDPVAVLPAERTPADQHDGPAVAAPIDPLRPEVRVDLDDRSAQLDLWGRVRRGFGMSDLDTDLVRKNEQWYATRPDYVQRMTERGGRYLYHIVEEVEKRGLPSELALLPFIESAFNPQANSVANASGMWQFVPATGRDFSLKQNIFRDDRRDVLASTRAALDYLTRLNAEFNDWHLTLAAYNWGVGNVRKAIARNQRAGLPTDYLSLRMPDETRNYVPKLQAVKNIVLRPETFSLSLPVLANHPYFLSVPIERDMDVDLAARLAGLSTDEFKLLNPQMNKPVILAAGTPQVLLPYDNANSFVRNIDQHRGPLATWTAWVANKTLRPAEAAKQLGVSEDLLREVNRIPPRMLVKAGSTLLVPRNERRKDDVPEHLADNATLAFAPDAPPPRRVSIKAGKKGDSVAAVAKRYGVSATQVAQWNKVAPHASFKPGQVIALFLPAGRAAAVDGSHAATRRTAKPAATARKAASKPARVRVAKD
ncbi:transglycosylase SLT domain-containing protein [Ideonella sp. BN130291]|uniref:transglycosylase SLT domain-containing protein n=1 Tax=Ideonella sp. BN130291 TaxID=3112940 RepID=UPI002E27170A|nr:transglycosylase SLT domain-containing protein [Ideonella sp. BN130291]